MLLVVNNGFIIQWLYGRIGVVYANVPYQQSIYFPTSFTTLYRVSYCPVIDGGSTNYLKVISIGKDYSGMFVYWYSSNLTTSNECYIDFIVLGY